MVRGIPATLYRTFIHNAPPPRIVMPHVLRDGTNLRATYKLDYVDAEYAHYRLEEIASDVSPLDRAERLELERLRMAALRFIAKVDSGRACSKESYADFKAALGR